MNLFNLDENLTTNAQYHVDKHVGKMILEAVQLLCTAFHLQDIKAPYRKTHQNHPSSIWTRQSKENFEWTIEYATKLSEEFTFRRGKVHKSSLVLSFVNENKKNLSFDFTGSTKFALAMPDEFKVACPIESYRNYYRVGKAHLHKWSLRDKPHWI